MKGRKKLITIWIIYVYIEYYTLSYKINIKLQNYPWTLLKKSLKIYVEWFYNLYLFYNSIYNTIYTRNIIIKTFHPSEKRVQNQLLFPLLLAPFNHLARVRVNESYYILYFDTESTSCIFSWLLRTSHINIIHC